jgi:hypothetical protein
MKKEQVNEKHHHQDRAKGTDDRGTGRQIE